MRRIRAGMSRQQETMWVVGLALLSVLAYSLWGAALLRQGPQASEAAPGAVVANS